MITIVELKETATFFGKDTKRKKILFFKKFINDLDYVINHIEPQLEVGVMAWHLGERLSAMDLRKYKAERLFIEENFLELIN